MTSMMQEKLVPIQQLALITGLASLYKDEILCDTTLEAENEQIKVHKCVLAAISPYFRAMFTFESHGPESPVKLHDVTGSVLCEIVRFLYTGHITVDDNNVQALTSAANMLQIEPLQNYCVDYMSNALCVENCLEVFLFADHLCLSSLKTKVEGFFLDHFVSIYHSDQFCHLDCFTLAGLLKSDDLYVIDEAVVFEAVMLWIKHDPEKRKRDLLTLLLCVRLPLMDAGYIEKVVCQESVVTDNVHCSDLVNQTLAYFKVGKPLDSDSFSSTPRLGMYEKEMVVFSGGAFSSNDRAFSCLDLDSYESYYSIEPHCSFDFKYKIDLYRLVVTPRGEIFCIGGIFYNDYHFQRESVEASNAVLQYDQRNRVWNSMPSLPVGKCGFAACCYEQSIYTFGGYVYYPGVPPCDQVLWFDCESDIWKEGQTMPVKMALQAAASVGENAYLFGGKDETEECLPLVLQYTYKTDQWAMLDTTIPKPMAEATAVPYKDKIFLLGGSNRNGYIASLIAFEPGRLRWSFYDDFPEHRKLLAIAGSDKYIFVVGGVKHLQQRSGGTRGGRTVECRDLYRYSIDKNIWTKESRNVKFGSCYVCCVATVNTKLLTANTNKSPNV